MLTVESQFEASAPTDEPSSDIRLLFDSGPGPVAAGVRSEAASRRFAYETTDYYIEVRVEPDREAAGGRVIGKITNRGIGSQQAAQDLGVCLLNGKSPIVAAFTNQAGEFQRMLLRRTA